jgi:hypothetical protein
VLAWPGVRDEGKPLRTRTRSSAWLTGAGDPIVSVEGHAGGIALTHIEHDPSRQPAIPDVEFQMPPCPICGQSLDRDGDELCCHNCRATWSSNGSRGRWYEPEAKRCLATCRRYPTHEPDLVDQCALAAHHDLKGDVTHHSADGFTSWTDDSDTALTDSAGEAIE